MWEGGLERGQRLSVSSNGSKWVKLQGRGAGLHVRALAFSILERIEVGETKITYLERVPYPHLSVSSNGSKWVKQTINDRKGRMSKLSVSSNGSKWVKLTLSVERRPAQTQTFSILERIEVGETNLWYYLPKWAQGNFQYPRTDRSG